MKRLRDFFTNKWVVGLIGLLALSLLIWYGADYIKFGSDNATLSHKTRLTIIVFLFAVWIVWHLSQWLVERRQNRALIDEIEESQDEAVDPDEARSREELGALSNRFREAMEVLRKARFKSERGNVSLYQLPWYIIIGPPGSGKTTALVNSGLEFPLANSHGKEALGGVGGTRNCDWWFTNDAVLIDTAGRYTTQDSHRVHDNSAWQAFLGLLKRYRRRRPINGALVAISLQDLMVQTAEQRLHQAKTIRQRIDELQRELGIRFPIYLTFTKCDLVAGFSEFFDNLSQAEREQVWGVSFPAETSTTTGAPLDTFAEEFAQLIERLNQRVLWRVHQERNIEKRALLQGFPARMENLQGVLADFIKQTFGANRYDTVPMVRGIYFTSGTQEGSPIDRMMASISADFGLERDMGQKFQGSGKSFFLHRLLKDVVFPEAELVGVNRKIEAATQWLRRGVYVSLAVVFAGALFLWTGSVARNKVYMGEVDRHIAEYQKAQASVGDKFTPIASLKVLEPLRHAASVYEREDHPWLSNLGLYDDRVDQAADRLYRQQLTQTFLPALMRDIERDLTQLGSDDPALAGTLKDYLMFFNPDKFDTAELENYYTTNWERQLSGKADQLAQFNDHLQALLAEPLPATLQPNERVVARARQQLRRVPVPQRLYAQLQRSDLGVTPVDLYGEIGGDTEQLFGVAASDPKFSIPYLYTKAGYKELDFGADSPLLTQLSDERWIYGGEISGEEFTEADRKQLGEDVKRIYLSEYQQRWDQFLRGFAIQRFRSTSQALDTLAKLADPVYSPLLAVAEITADNTRLTPRPELPSGASGVAMPVSSTTRKLGSAAVSGAAGALQGRFQPTSVDLRFEELQRLTQSEKGRPARIQEYLAAITKVQEYLTEIDSAADANEAAFASAKARFSGGGGDAIKQLRIKAANAPVPFDGWLNAIADSTWALVMAKAKLHADRIWRDQVYSNYARSLANRYPLRSDRDQEVPVMEFNKFFKPGGTEQAFVSEYLKPFIDTRNWKVKSLEGQGLGLSQTALSQLRRAERIRDTFFSAGEQASYSFRIEPTKLDSSVRLFELEIGGQRVPYSHGPRTPKKLTWRGGESNRVRIIFEDLNETVHRQHFEGDWAWYRLLGSSDLESGRSSTEYFVTFEEEGRKAQFRLLASAASNPFDSTLLGGYRCPETL
ncbi:type VI secretion system membrane subunit TssM [Microbulbifer hainanensis]|uniref:type VI secretion system membrane subunit TssM n=1 Tax=Microbulbifer hainanensis TaxID=2735675 RepID=UPI0018660B19|nr:type VI secretion system membrane subunit TssM [Microbulbifer hainanensis]